ncbi:MAG: DUF4920 domain-containing protein [Myxococcaceae bacterium]
MLTLTSAVVTLLLAGAPANSPGNPCHHDDKGACGPATDAPADKDGIVRRGEAPQGAPTVKLAELLKRPSAHDGKTVLVEGEVRQACSRKGCWMELATANADKGPGVRVTFKDYGFFVPLDSAGSRAKVKGLVKVAQLSEDTVKHYESEGATVPRGKDGKPNEVQLIATGVELRR